MNSSDYFRGLIMSAGADLWVSLAALLLVLTSVSVIAKEAPPESVVDESRPLVGVELPSTASGKSLDSDEFQAEIEVHANGEYICRSGGTELTHQSAESVVASLASLAGEARVLILMDGNATMALQFGLLDAFRDQLPAARIEFGAIK